MNRGSAPGAGAFGHAASRRSRCQFPRACYPPRIPLYASTFPTGFEDVIREELLRRLPGVTVRRVDAGIVVYESALAPAKIAAVPFFTNGFSILTFCPQVPVDEPIGPILSAFRADPDGGQALMRACPRGKRRYGVKASVGSAMAQVPHFLRAKLEKTLAEHGMLHKPEQPDVELWFLARREGYGFFGVRLEKTHAENRPPEKGELKPELASLLCVLTQPKPTDRFLDPCAGNGSIPIARALLGPAARIVSADANAAHVAVTAKRAKALGVSVESMVCDALSLSPLPDGSIDVLVTDPPWGVFDEKDFDYAALLRQISRVTAPGARIVVLLARHIALGRELSAHPELRPGKQLSVLVNGQKATAHVWRRA